MSEAAKSVIYAAGEMRHVLLLRGERDIWRLPQAGEFAHGGEAQSLTDGLDLVRLDSTFDPEGIPGRDFMWPCHDFALHCSPVILDPDLVPAIRRFDGELIMDLIFSMIEEFAAAEPTTVENGVSDMSADPQKMRALQVAADPAYRAIKDEAPRAVTGEDEWDYMRRVLRPLMGSAKRWTNDDLAGLRGPAAYKIADEIIGDFLSEIRHPTRFARGELRKITALDAAGRPHFSYVGDPNGCWDQFNAPVRHIRRVLTPGAARVQ